MAEVIKQAKFIKADAKNNNNKFWYITLFNDASILTENGRVGSKAQQHPKSFGSQESAETFYGKKIKEKQGKSKGYTELKVVVGKQEVQSVGQSSLTEIAIKDIASNSPDTAKLIRYLSKKNIHNIVSSTTIEYDESKGTFSTPCGIVTQEGIDDARELLGDISTFITKNDLDNTAFTKAVQDYIQIIPRKVGRKFIPKEVIPDTEAVDKETQILDALTASLQQVIAADDADDGDTKTKAPDAPKIFDVSVDVVTDKKIIDHIKKFYNKTRNSMHTSASLKVKKVYAVKLGHMHKAYKAKGKPIGNIMELWHGTRVENVLSILKGGLIIPKSSAGHVTGRMYGDGSYFSDQSTKSLNYAQGYWGNGSKDNNCFMFLANVAMGKAYTPTCPDSRLHDKIKSDGYDSCYAKAGKSGVRNNEMIVYNLYQCDLTYLVEFSG